MEAPHRILSVLFVIVSVAAAGCVSGTVDDAVDGAGTEGLEGTVQPIVTDAVDGMIARSTATPVVSFNHGGTFSFPLPRSANVTGFVLELEWASTAPVNDKLDLWVRDASAGAIPPEDPTSPVATGPIAKATGPSVLRLEVPADAFPDDAEYAALVRAAGPVGVAAEQPFTLHVTTFTDTPFDATYSALADA